MATTKTTPKIGDYGTYVTSPYTVVLHSKLHAVKPKHQAMTDENGELWGMYKVPKNETIVIDPRPYTKVFDGNQLLFASLIEPAAKMLYYMFGKLRPGSDEICIIQSEYNAFFGYKVSNRFVYYKAVEGLLRANIMAKKAGSTSCFFINPDILFNGDRTKLKNIDVRPPDRPFDKDADRVFHMPPNNDI